ncbi:MAG: MarR family winged helix-turn-helix transcriptional regulator [bacterium]|nr:MarR family winged helix-turn-helix transcriptional regulator [Clostridium sp.]MDD7629948.1 MarR family winged helix-turn-helix transcriptional regulator [bacterium]MDY4108632.1 MarR family winged helix-turn-helix transcriptional regulator [Bacilli bacterium]MDY4184075.1 MarR family winged helix-turn-helix transcriptional regulator [Candidatus Onthovivens sp.]
MKIPVQAQVIKKLYDNSFDDLRIKYGLTMNEIMFLLYLDKNKANNTASEIVENLVTTKSHISKSIDSLAKRNIIIRIQDELDKKIIRLYISDTANDLLYDLRTREEIINRTITKGIPKDDLENFNRVLEQMKKNVYDLINKF